MYRKIIRYILWLLLAVSAVIAIYAYAAGFTDNAVDTLLYWAYAMAIVGIVASVVIAITISAVNNPKSLLKMLGVLVGVAVIVGVAYLLAPGTPAVGYLGPEVPGMTLKLTDTILNLTYFACGASIIVIIGGVIMDAVRNK